MAHIEPAQVGTPISSPTDSLPLDLILPMVLGLLTKPGTSLTSLKQDLRGWATDDPLDSLLMTVVGGGLAFYLAEREHNPACKNPWDGILYMATCLSVGYDNLFPTTSAGHALGSAAQTLGPALVTRAFDAPAAETRLAAAAAQAAADDAAAVNRAILARLEDIVRLLEQPKP